MRSSTIDIFNKWELLLLSPLWWRWENVLFNPLSHCQTLAHIFCPRTNIQNIFNMVLLSHIIIPNSILILQKIYKKNFYFIYNCNLESNIYMWWFSNRWIPMNIHFHLTIFILNYCKWILNMTSVEFVLSVICGYKCHFPIG